MNKLSRYSSVALLFASACGTDVGGDTLPGSSEQVAKQSDTLYYESAGIWQKSTLSVCWVSDSNSSERTMVRDVVESTFEPILNLDFTGWGECTGAADIVIDASSSYWPHSTLGNRAASTTANIWLNHFRGSARDLDGDATKDFVGCWSNEAASGTPVTGPTGEYFNSKHRYCIETIAMHEFAHMLGIAHEQNRSDTPSTCTAADDGTGDTEYGYWDLLSISNYCNPAWNGDALLSPLDVSGLVSFYGAKTNDQVWYGIGNVRNYAGVSTDQLMFKIYAQTVTGTYEPLIEDYNGDGESDIFWYAPGSTAERLWFGDDDDADRGVFIRHDTTFDLDNTYEMVTGDFNGDGKGDIFMHAPGSVYDRVWYGRSDKTFDSVRHNISGTYQPLAGDFNGDGIDDVFLYAAGDDTDYIWWGQTDESFDSDVVGDNVTGSYRPKVGDFDGDGRSDILWYQPGGDKDEAIWWGRSNKTFDTGRLNENVSGTYDLTVGDFDGNGTSDIVFSSSKVKDSIWLFSRTRGSFVSTPISSILDAKPYAGDFDGDGLDDIFWYGAGTN